jgi:hypothetical protein
MYFDGSNRSNSDFMAGACLAIGISHSFNEIKSFWSFTVTTNAIVDKIDKVEEAQEQQGENFRPSLIRRIINFFKNLFS